MDQRLLDFRETVWAYYGAHGRHDLLWRQPDVHSQFDPYRILVSELMLQQTQVPRVIPKFAEFIARFPTITALATAPLEEVLRVWSGLGYNRRAKFLWQTAQIVVRDHHGELPRSAEALVALPGIGANTAGAILAYAFNQPVTFLETNIRTVFIHHFFHDQDQVADRALLPLVSAALDTESPREWYWALMDYGTHLKQTVGNRSRASKSYVKQSAFEGSRRQIRGQVLRSLGEQPRTLSELATIIPDQRLPGVVADLADEGMIHDVAGTYRLGSIPEAPSIIAEERLPYSPPRNSTANSVLQ